MKPDIGSLQQTTQLCSIHGARTTKCSDGLGMICLLKSGGGNLKESPWCSLEQKINHHQRSCWRQYFSNVHKIVRVGNVDAVNQCLTALWSVSTARVKAQTSFQSPKRMLLRLFCKDNCPPWMILWRTMNTCRVHHVQRSWNINTQIIKSKSINLCNLYNHITHKLKPYKLKWCQNNSYS